MKQFYKAFRKFCFCTFNGKIYTAEVIYSFYNIINLYCLICNANSFSFKNKTCLIMRKSWTFNIVWIVCKVYLNFMINAALKAGFERYGYLIPRVLKLLQQKYIQSLPQANYIMLSAKYEGICLCKYWLYFADRLFILTPDVFMINLSILLRNKNKISLNENGFFTLEY